MKKVLGIIFLLFLTAILLFTGWFMWYFKPWIQPDCANTEQVFDKNAPTLTEYKQKLAQELNGQSNLHFWFRSYNYLNGKHHFLLHVKGNSLCAEMDIISVGCGNIAKADGQPCNLIRLKGRGYEGLPIEGLRYEVVEEDSTINFYWKGYERFID